MKNKFLNDKVATIILNDENLRDYVASVISKATDLDFELINKNLVLDSNRINASIETKYSEVDAMYHNDDIYFNIEVNLSKGISTEKKNFRYICNAILKQVPPGSKDNFKKLYQININNYDILNKNEFIYQSCILEEKYLIRRSDFIKIIDINMDYLRKIDYNVIEEDNNSLEYLLYIFVCEDKSIRKELYSDDTIMEKVNKKLEELNKLIEEVYFDPEETWKEIATEEAEKKAKKDIAKKMLEDNMDINNITKYTNLTIEEIKELENKNE